jgi:hypothetical protein
MPAPSRSTRSSDGRQCTGPRRGRVRPSAARQRRADDRWSAIGVGRHRGHFLVDERLRRPVDDLRFPRAATSPASKARCTFSNVPRLGARLASSMRCSVSGRMPARRANSACDQPKARRERMLPPAITQRVTSRNSRPHNDKKPFDLLAEGLLSKTVGATGRLLNFSCTASGDSQRHSLLCWTNEVSTSCS